MLFEILVGPPVICLDIIKLESARFTFDIFSFGNGVNIPDPSRFWTIGVTSLNGDDVDMPEARTAPSLTPVWTPTAPKVSVLPSTETVSYTHLTLTTIYSV